MADERYGYLTSSGDELHIDVLSETGVDRVGTMTPGEPCDCACSSLLYEGILYGPGTPAEVHAAMLRMPKQVDLSLGNTSYLREKYNIEDFRSLADLEPLFAPPGEAVGDD